MQELVYLQEIERRMIAMKNNLSLIILLIFIILSCLIISLRIWFRIKEVNKQKESLNKGRLLLPFVHDKDLLETIASNEGVFISDLPRDKLLQKKAVLFILNHTDDYDKDEQLKALDYLYMKKKEGIKNGKINT